MSLPYSGLPKSHYMQNSLKAMKNKNILHFVGNHIVMSVCNYLIEITPIFNPPVKAEKCKQMSAVSYELPAYNLNGKDDKKRKLPHQQKTFYFKYSQSIIPLNHFYGLFFLHRCFLLPNADYLTLTMYKSISHSC